MDFDLNANDRLMSVLFTTLIKTFKLRKSLLEPLQSFQTFKIKIKLNCFILNS